MSGAMSEIEVPRFKRPKTGGRKRGTANVVTRDVKQAIAAFAEGNVHRLREWIERVAETDPAKAADLFIRLLEYHVPKLARSEVEVRAHPPTPVREMSLAELQAIAAEANEAELLRLIPKSITARTKDCSQG